MIIGLTISMLSSVLILAQTVQNFTLNMVKNILLSYSKCISYSLNKDVVRHITAENS